MKSHTEFLTKQKLTMLQDCAREVERTSKNEFSIRIFKDNITKYNNLQKLRFHGLITHVEKNGVKQRGLWLITRQGWEFLEGKKELPKWVEVQDNHIVNRSGQTISVREVYHGSEAIVTTFNYSDGDREWVAPIVQPDLQLSLITEDVRQYKSRDSVHA